MKKARPIMIQGTTSNAGKSIVAAGLCRVFMQDGHRVAPFKSQNMALNSYVTLDGLEMGRAQVTQAQAAGLEPDVRMNPVLLKPTTDVGSQVILNGEVVGNMSAMNYFKYKRTLRPEVQKAYESLAAENDIVVIEGAGSPAEINLKAEDIVNMGMAQMADAPVLLVADIDRGGVFASIYGTIALLEPEERSRIKGVIINKFRGDKAILQSGIDMIAELTDIPVLGVLPYLNIDIDDEDSLTDRFSRQPNEHCPLDIVVVRLPRISNFTDFDALARHPSVGLRYVGAADELGSPDLVILPGSKSTMADLLWMRQNGLESGIKKLAASGTLVAGVCGGYQMLGRLLKDPYNVEGGGELRGMELLDTETVFSPEKVRTRISGKVSTLTGELEALSGAELFGYEIHMGNTKLRGRTRPFTVLEGSIGDGAVYENVFGSYVHGLFDGGLGNALVNLLLARKGLCAEGGEQISAAQHREQQFDFLAAAIRESFDMTAIYKIMEEGA
ncbi:cobyric acid synthase [Oscillospiraceae bacterium LTW-04]|nr:cobyric acid synthase [Oscillospiraceae bacterium MB24-C1]